MGRLASFDYKSPYYYMVTLKRLKGLAAFSEIGPDGHVENEITRAFKTIIKGFHAKWRCCEEISPFVIMPDHLHLLIKIRDIPDRVALGVLVNQLAKALRNAYWQIVAADAATGKTLSAPSEREGEVLRPRTHALPLALRGDRATTHAQGTLRPLP